MDIYAYANEMNYLADYYDPHTGYTYKIQDYGIALKQLAVDETDHHLSEEDRAAYQEVINKGIAVWDSNGLIGYAKKKEE